MRVTLLLPAFSDTWPGEFRRATAAFKEGTTTPCSAVPVALISAETTTGTASCAATLGVGAHTIDVLVGGWYVCTVG